MIGSLTVENFGPFRKPATFPLVGQGLVLVRGRNMVSESADSNGVGKTSIPHAVAFALYGEDLEGRRADAVACRFTEGTCVTHLDLDDDLGPWSVTRTRRPTGLKVTGIDGVLENEDAAVVQAKVTQRLGYGLRTFKNAVVFGQGTFERFAQAGQDEQMRMLDEVQGVDYRDPHKRAVDWRKDLAAKLASATADLETKRRVLEQVESTVADMRRARDGFEAARTDRLTAIESRVEAARSRLRCASDDVKQARADALVHSTLSKEAALGDALSSEHERLLDTATRAVEDARRATEARSGLDADLAALVAGGSCPKCRQPVRARQKVVRKAFDKDLRALLVKASEASARSERALVAAEDAEKKAAGQTKKLAALAPAGQTVVRYLAELGVRCGERAASLRAKAVADATSAVESASRERVAEVAAVWDGADALASAEGKVASTSVALVTVQARASKLSTALSVADYWCEAFGDHGIRSMLVDGVADFVNERLAAHLEKLACGEATTRMSAKTDLKSGRTKDRISFATEWAWGGAGPDDGSGGQDRRRDLAVFAAIQDLAESRSARPFSLKVWDEPGDNLDARGQELFLRWVESEARSRGTGLLMTHSEGIASMADPDHVWTIVLERDGARVEFG